MTFPPIPLYPTALDSDYSLFHVYNTTEAKTSSNNQAWSEEIDLVPASSFFSSGYANIDGELFYYDAVSVNDDDEVIKLKRCTRNLGGKKTKFNPAGTWVRGFVVAEHHNQFVTAILNTEGFIGENFSEDEETLDYRIRNLNEENVVFDDFACPDVEFAFNILSSGITTGTVAQYEVTVTGNFGFLEVQFGDGTSTTIPAGTHTYSPNANIDPVVIVSNDSCQIVQTPVERDSVEEPEFDEPVPPFSVPGIIAPDIPPFVFPGDVFPSVDIAIPPIVFPCIDLNPILTGIPSLISILIPDITVPTTITISPISIPSINVSVSFPALGPISFANVPTFGPILFGPAPSFGPILFGPTPSFVDLNLSVTVPSIVGVLISFTIPDTIEFGPAPSFGPILFGPAPSFGPILFGPAPSFDPIQFGPAPSFNPISFGPAPSFGPILFGPAPSISVVFPSVIAVALNFDFIQFGPAPNLGPIEFGPAPQLGPIEFGPAPSLGPIQFAPFPSFGLISFMPFPSFGLISFAQPFPSFGPILFGPTPTVQVAGFFDFDTEAVSFGPILFGPTPSFSPIGFASEGISFGPIDFGPAPSFSPIEFNTEGVSFAPIEFGPAPSFAAIEFNTEGVSFAPIDFGEAPALSIQWGTPPTINCTCTVVCPSGSSVAAAAAARQPFNMESAVDPGFDNIELQYDMVGFPSEIKIVPPEMPLKLDHNLPTEISLVIPELPKLEIAGLDLLPKEIKLVLPKEEDFLNIISFALPEKIIFDTSSLPEAIPLVFKEIPVISFFVPESIKVVGIPDVLKVEGVPSFIDLHVPDGLRVPMYFDGPPLSGELRVNWGLDQLGTDDEDRPCFALVPCKK